MVIKKISCACGSFPRSSAHRERSLLGQAQAEWRGEKRGAGGPGKLSAEMLIPPGGRETGHWAECLRKQFWEYRRGWGLSSCLGKEKTKT